MPSKTFEVTAHVSKNEAIPFKIESGIGNTTELHLSLGEIERVLNDLGILCEAVYDESPSHEQLSIAQVLARSYLRRNGIKYVEWECIERTEIRKGLITFKDHDYVLYTGNAINRKGFWTVHAVNGQTATLRHKNGGQVTDCPFSDLKLLYRPTNDEIEDATRK